MNRRGHSQASPGCDHSSCALDVICRQLGTFSALRHWSMLWSAQAQPRWKQLRLALLLLACMPSLQPGGQPGVSLQVALSCLRLPGPPRHCWCRLVGLPQLVSRLQHYTRQPAVNTARTPLRQGTPSVMQDP